MALTIVFRAISAVMAVKSSSSVSSLVSWDSSSNDRIRPGQCELDITMRPITPPSERHRGSPVAVGSSGTVGCRGVHSGTWSSHS